MSDNDGSRIDAGRLFQTRGPLTANDRSPNVVLVDGTSSGYCGYDVVCIIRRSCVIVLAQVEDYALRKNSDVSFVEKCLSPVLAYDIQA